LDEQQSCFWLTNSKAAFCICSNDASAMFWCMANISWCLNNISRAAPWFGTWLTFVAMLLVICLTSAAMMLQQCFGAWPNHLVPEQH
jgi:hypothetical protein